MMPGISSVTNRGCHILIEPGVLRPETEWNTVSHRSGTSGDKCMHYALFVYSYIILSVHALIEGRPVETEQERFCLFVCLFVCDDANAGVVGHSSIVIAGDCGCNEPVSVSSGIPHVDIEGGVVIYGA